MSRISFPTYIRLVDCCREDALMSVLSNPKDSTKSLIYYLWLLHQAKQVGAKLEHFAYLDEQISLVRNILLIPDFSHADSFTGARTSGGIRMSRIILELFENAHQWKTHQWNPHEPRTRCMLFSSGSRSSPQIPFLSIIIQAT